MFLPHDENNRHADHLNTPRLVADATGTTVWRWDQTEPFGSNPPDENPSGLGVFDLPLRLPGQYYDKETGLHYNYFRDYDPGLGIYKQSDPIGLAAGLNTFSYVASAPLQSADFFGLLRTCGTGKIGERITPNFYYGRCCGEHDDCYDDCTNRPSKDSCDRDFANCTFGECSRRWIATKFACEYFAVIFNRVVRGRSGQDAFDDARGKCSCKP